MNPYIVGNYKLTEKIGEGGMGAVFKGVDWMLEREVAVKVLRPELARQPHVLERFRAEAVTLAKLSHPNIATLYSFLRQGDDFYMVMEFVRGETLDSIIRRSGALPVDRAVALFCQALDGIGYAHKHGVVHRDIKPANIMLTGDGIVKVMDFGIARVLGSARMTRQGSIVGTVEYMSPEHVRGLETDARSDIYSLGILLYEMLTGRVPFSSSSEFDLMKAQIEDPPPPPRQFAPHIPEVIEQAILRSLAKAPDARFQTAGAFRDMLVGGMRPRTEPTSAAVIRETSGSTGPAPVRPAPSSTPTVHQAPIAKPSPPPSPVSARGPAPASAFCPRCRTAVQVGSAFCLRCGMPLAPAATPVVRAARPGTRSGLLAVMLLVGICLIGFFLWLVVIALSEGAVQDPTRSSTTNTNKAPIASAPLTGRRDEPQASPPVQEAELIPGWKRHQGRGTQVTSTRDWTSYDLARGRIPYSIQYPPGWKFGDEMLWDEKGEKVLELLPGGVWLKKGQSCFDRRPSSTDDLYPSRLIQQESVTFGPVSGVRRTVSTVYEAGAARESGELFVTSYCLQQGNRAFVMTFYERDYTTPDRRQLFDRIVSTFRFK